MRRDTHFPASGFYLFRKSPEVFRVSRDQSDVIPVFCKQSAIVRTHHRLTSLRHVTGKMLTQTTRRHLQVRGEYEEAVSADCARHKFILIPVPFPIPAMTAMAFFVVTDMIQMDVCIKGALEPAQPKS